MRSRGAGSAGNGKGRGFCSHPDACRRCRRNYAVMVYLTPKSDMCIWYLTCHGGHGACPGGARRVVDEPMYYAQIP